MTENIKAPKVNLDEKEILRVDITNCTVGELRKAAELLDSLAEKREDEESPDLWIAIDDDTGVFLSAENDSEIYLSAGPLSAVGVSLSELEAQRLYNKLGQILAGEFSE